MAKRKIDFSLAMERIRNDKCPVCDGSDLKFENIDNGGFQNIECRCGVYWTLYHTLSGFGNLCYEISDTVTRSPEADEEETDVENITYQEIGIKDNPNLNIISKWPEILQAVLGMKKMLPALIGIDPELDKLIAERLKR